MGGLGAESFMGNRSKGRRRNQEAIGVLVGDRRERSGSIQIASFATRQNSECRDQEIGCDES